MAFSSSLAPSCPLAPFSDQTHLQFYAPHPLRPIKNRHPLPRLHAVALPCSPIAQPLHPSPEQDAWKELADLKADIKQKKDQLKDRMKEMKKQLKNEMKAKKQALKEQKTKMTKDKDCSSSSSSSESSDGECESVDMKDLRRPQEKPTESKGCIPVLASVVQEISPQGPCMDKTLGDDSVLVSAQTASNSPQLHFSCPSAKLSKEAGKIEVCVGGKCKKGGSEQLLSSLRAQIPGDSSVEAVPCKCMGKCGMSINVKVQKQETNPQHHSHVGVGDAGLLLSHHFGLGPPPTGLPSFGHQAMPCLAPERLTVAT